MSLLHLKHPEAGVADEEVENIEEDRKFLERWHWSCPRTESTDQKDKPGHRYGKTTNLITTTWKSGGGGADFLNGVEGLYRLKKI